MELALLTPQNNHATYHANGGAIERVVGHVFGVVRQDFAFVRALKRGDVQVVFCKKRGLRFGGGFGTST